VRLRKDAHWRPLPAYIALGGTHTGTAVLREKRRGSTPKGSLNVKSAIKESDGEPQAT
jgi:hypothetical protein